MTRITGLILVLILTAGIFSCEFSVERYYNQKCRQYRLENLSVQPGQIVFVGDSITDHCDFDTYYDLPLTVYNRGIGADTVEGLTGRMDLSIYDLEPELIVFLMGINDIYTGRTNEELYESYRQVFDGISTSLPGTKVLVQSIYPIDVADPVDPSKPSAINLRIQEVNQELQKIALSHQYSYIDLFSLMGADSSLRMTTEYVSDGLHPNPEGFRFISSHLNPAIIDLLKE